MMHSGHLYQRSNHAFETCVPFHDGSFGQGSPLHPEVTPRRRSGGHLIGKGAVDGEKLLEGQWCAPLSPYPLPPSLPPYLPLLTRGIYSTLPS